MAQVQLKPPSPFDFKTPDDWPRWKRRFEQFRVASGLSQDDASKQVNTLLYCLGEEAEDVLASTNPSREETQAYDAVMLKFDSFFKIRKNVIFERARFNRRKQLGGESAEQYITHLYQLAENCDYGELKSEMIRDRLVVGIKDSALSENLQIDADLTLEKAKKRIRQREAVQEQQQLLKGGTSSTLEEIRSHRGGFKNRPRAKPSPKHPKQCTRCGKELHSRDKCPARDVTCHRCQKKGHYSTQCYSKRTSTAPVSEVTSESHLDTAFLDTLTTGLETSWTIKLQLQRQMLTFKMDTGAEVTAISEESYKNLGKHQLTPPEKILYGPSRQPLQVIGQFIGEISYKGKSINHPVFVVAGLKTNLLGLPAITSLNLAARINNLHALKDEVLDQFPSVFQGLGTLGEEYEIQLKSDAKPFSLFTARNVPLPLRKKVLQELDRMEHIGVISKVDQPTPWCAGMVVVPKKSGSIRICVDLKPLNESVLREVHPLPKVDDTLAQLAGAKIFSKLDANSGFWQIPLAKESRLLTTFITPYGRYCFNKLPFGISSAPELFQKRMNNILRGLEGVLCLMDDILIFAKDMEEHHKRVTSVLIRIKEAGVTLNMDKCEFAKFKITFLGHLIDENGIQADPAKTSSILQMEPPTNVPELRRFLGMVNQLGKFSRNLAELTQPLRELLSKKQAWLWGPNQEQAFSSIKNELSQPTTLTLYNPEAQTKVSADASSYGLGAVLLQKSNDLWKPVAFASRTMTETERRYAQIEKEALATTWACEKFASYLLGLEFMIETDHKPLVPLLGMKNLDSLPPRVLRFRLRLNRFSYSIVHVPGKLMYTADTLSRSLLKSDISELQEIAETFIDACVAHLPASNTRLDEYREAQAADPICSRLIGYCQQGWPTKNNIDIPIGPYWKVRSELSIHNKLLLHGKQIVVPKSLQQETLSKIHQGHQGIERCRLRAKSSVWWPGISQQIKHLIEQCPVCVRNSTPKSQPLIPSELPDYPWQRVGTDLFAINGVNYLLIVDYFSRYPEVIKLSSTTSSSVIKVLKSIFSRHGIPETLVSDNGPQYTSQEFTDFSKSYDFTHITSSPHFPQSNGQAERTVQTVKRLLKQSSDPYMALLNYRTTPLLWCNISPARLLMGRSLRTNLPQLKEHLCPKWEYLEEFRQCNSDYKRKQKRYYDIRHRVHPLPFIPNNTEVWVNTGNQQVPGRVVAPSNTPRSYLVDTPSGQVRRNRQHLVVLPSNSDHREKPIANTTRQRSPVMTRSRTNATIRPPNRYIPGRGDVA